MKQPQAFRGFTIVELLIVIVVIAILAAISLIAFNGIQARARDTARANDIKAITKALELYRIDNGAYPPTSITPNPQTTCSGIGAGYSYSWDTSGAWLKPLIDGKYIQAGILPPVNDCTRHYRYIKSGGVTWGCSASTDGWYVLQVMGADGAAVPSTSKSFKPCPEATVTVTATPNIWVFSGFDNN